MAMIPFNKPYMTGEELEYIREAHRNGHLSGEGPFTKRCHAWVEERGPMLCLMGAIDDATGELLPGAHFVEQECAAGYLQVLKAIAEEKGLPWSAYMDQHGSLKRNDDHWTLEEQLRGVQEPTQVGRSLEALEIEV